MRRFGELKKPIRIAISSIIIAVFILAILLYAMLATINIHKTYFYEYKGFTTTRVIAHRGYSGKYFDNTKESFEAAAQESFFSGIETDIRVTADGVWVCSHDDNPFKDKKVKISESSYADIKDLALDTSGAAKGVDVQKKYTVPTFYEYLDICFNANKIALVEIKGKYSAEELNEPVEKATDLMPYGKIMFGSFHLSAIESVREVFAYSQVLLFTDQSLVAFCYNEMGYGVGVNKKILTEKSVKRAREDNLPTFVYTIKTKEEYNKYSKLKVDYIISNYAF